MCIPEVHYTFYLPTNIPMILWICKLRLLPHLWELSLIHQTWKVLICLSSFSFLLYPLWIPFQIYFQTNQQHFKETAELVALKWPGKNTQSFNRAQPLSKWNMPFSVKNDDCKPTQLKKNHNSLGNRKKKACICISLQAWHSMHCFNSSSQVKKRQRMENPIVNWSALQTIGKHNL